MGILSDSSAPIFIAGHRGLVGSAITRNLQSKGFTNLLLKTRTELDLRDRRAVSDFFQKEKPAYVFLAAAKVGGIKANSDAKADFLLENLEIQNSVISAAVESGVHKLLFLGSSCIYPKLAPQPMREDSLLTGALEPTNEGYALAKITGLKLCQYLNEEKGLAFISAMPTNLYGTGDNLDPEKSHVIPGMMVRLHRAKQSRAPQAELWGTGTPRREFLHADDCADALIFLMEHYNDPQPINVGCGEDLSIAELAKLVAQTVGYEGKIVFNSSYPDGSPRKLLDVSKIRGLGWQSQIKLPVGLKSMYRWALDSRVLN